MGIPTPKLDIARPSMPRPPLDGHLFAATEFARLDGTLPQAVLDEVDAPTGLEIWGDAYIVSDTPTAGSAFEGHANTIASLFLGGTWVFQGEDENPGFLGLQVWNVALGKLRIYGTGGWADAPNQP